VTSRALPAVGATVSVVKGEFGRPETVDRTWRLAELELFADLTEGEIAAIAATAPMRATRRGEILYGAGRAFEVLFILKSGRVRLYRVTPDGRTLTMAIVTPGQLFGQMAVLGQHLGDDVAEVLDPGVVCVMSRSDVNRLLLADPRIAARIAGLLAGRVADLERRLADTVLKPVPARICAALLRLTDSDRSPVRLTHQQIADLVGTSRETTTKVLGELQDAGVVQVRRGRVVVRDAGRLRDLSQ
jgi:CRP/FNR family transcriptional regulator, cyclic AMP receptor protein